MKLGGLTTKIKVCWAIKTVTKTNFSLLNKNYNDISSK